MKKEWIIIGALILLGVVYLVFKPDGRVKYEIPQWDGPEKSEITDIYYGSGEEKHLRIEDEQWVVGEPARNLKEGKGESILNALMRLRATDLVSQAEVYENYDLDDSHAVKVRVLAGDKEYSFRFGKKASISHGTYGLLPGDKGVFILTDDWNSLLPEDPNELRDKKVLSFDSTAIDRFLIRSVTEDRKVEFKKNDGQWELDGQAYEDADTLEMRLSVLGNLNCQTYMDSGTYTGDGQWEILLSGGSDEWSLQIYEEKDNSYICRSSQSEDAFTISAYQLRNTLSLLDE